jgi:hypothetical protein
VYHLELRQFPHNVCRFNLDERALQVVVEPWSRDAWVELGERKWSPHQAKLTILEGPQMPLDQLSMGRGWRAAQRQSEDVTDRVLAAAKQGASTTAEAPAQEPSMHQPSADAALVADSLGLELLALLGDGPAPLSQAWRLAAQRFPERPPSESLVVAERAVVSLLRARLIVLQNRAPQDGHGSARSGSEGAEVGEGEVEALLGAPDSWIGQAEAGGVLMRKA